MGLLDSFKNTIVNKVARPVLEHKYAGQIAGSRARAALQDTTFGEGTDQPNPEYERWLAAKTALETKKAGMGIAGGFGGNSKEKLAAIDAEIAALGPQPPQTIRTDLGQMVDTVKAQGEGAAGDIRSAADQLRRTGQQANSQGQQVSASLTEQGQDVQNRQAPTMAPTTGVERIRQATTAGVEALNKFAQGPSGPSAAEAQLRMQSDRDKRAALALARSARGGPAAVALALRRAQAENAATAAETRGQLGVLRAQETATERGQQLGALTTVASAGIQGEAAAAGVETDIAKTNLSAELQQTGLNDEQTRFFTGLGEQARQSGINAQLEAQKAGMSGDEAAASVALQYGQLAWQMLTTEQQAALTRIGIEQGAISAAQQDANQKTQQQMQFLGTILMAGGTVAKSDRRVKHAIRGARSLAADLRKSPGYEYRYRDQRDGKGRQQGPMAQDLEKTRAFGHAVKSIGGVKHVDTSRLALAHHGALADLQRQVDKLSKVVKRTKPEARR